MSASAVCDEVREILPLDVFEDAAEMKAEGKSWPTIAEAVQWDLRDLKRAARQDPRFDALVERVKRELHQQGEAEAYQTMREGLRSENSKERIKAAERLLKYHTALRNNETRIKLEEIRKDAKIGVAELRVRQLQAKVVKNSEPVEEAEPEAPAMTPEQAEQEKRFWERQERK